MYSLLHTTRRPPLLSWCGPHEDGGPQSVVPALCMLVGRYDGLETAEVEDALRSGGG